MDLERRGELNALGFIVIPDPLEPHYCHPMRAHRANFFREGTNAEGDTIGKWEVDPIVGTIFQCPECGLYWIVRGGEWGNQWRRMRWYHPEAKIVRRLNGKA